MTVFPGTTSADLTSAFEVLRTIISEWRDIGRITTTAGLKPAMQEALGHFSEREYGFDSFRAFILAAEANGWVQVLRLPNGHSLVGLPTESRETLEQIGGMQKTADPAVARQPLATNDTAGGQQFKSSVWLVFIDWRNDLRRLWDRDTQQAFMFPVVDGRPAWESAPDRFVEIPAVTFEQQVAWMHQWAETLPETPRNTLKSALAPAAPKGEFRRELTRLGLTTQWRAALQQLVSEHVSTWAEQQGVPLVQLIDSRRRQVEAPRTHAKSTPVAPAPRPSALRSVDSPAERAPAEASASSDLERLRQRLHRAIDRMSLAELAALPLRAEHFLFDD